MPVAHAARCRSIQVRAARRRPILEGALQRRRIRTAARALPRAAAAVTPQRPRRIPVAPATQAVRAGTDGPALRLDQPAQIAKRVPDADHSGDAAHSVRLCSDRSLGQMISRARW